MKYRNKSINLTIYGRLLMLAFTVLLLVFCSSIQVNASEITEPLTSDGASSETYTIIGVENIEAFANLPTLEIVRTSTHDTTPLLYYIVNNNLHRATVTLIVQDSFGNETELTGSIDWSVINEGTTVDTSVCGDYMETLPIKPPDGSYTWADGVPSVITFPVRVYEPESIEIVRIDSYEIDYNKSFSLELNADIDKFLRDIPLQKACRCYDASGNAYSAPVIYNGEAVRTDAVGIYHITVTFEEPFNCRFSETLDIPTYSIPVSVQALGQPRLDVSYIGAWNYIYFPWIAEDIYNTMEVWISENDGEWRLMKTDDEVFIHSTELQIVPYLLQVGNSYRIQVDYEGGQTGIASFTYGEDALSDQGYIEGDRDGGDTDGNPPMDSTDNENTNNTPPMDSTDNENTNNNPPETSPDNGNSSVTDTTVSTPEKKEPVTVKDNTQEVASSNENESPEIKKENTSIPAGDSEPEKETTEPATTNREKPYLLGSELNYMIQNMGTARFSEETIMLNIPEDAISSLEIGETDRLLVTILPLENNGFSIDILKNDVAVTNVSSMQVSLPYQPPANTTPVLMNEADTKVADGDYNPDTGLVSFTINETGIFYIQDEEVPMQDTFSANTLTVTEIATPEKDTDNSVFKLLAIVATVIITCSVGITIFIYTKKRRR